MSFWDWALAAYDRPGVAEACLALQDEHGQQTAFLLWAAWAAPDRGSLETGAELARHWDRAILGPLRQSRRALKPALRPVDDGQRLALREDIKAAELKAERLLMETLEGLSSRQAGPEAALAAMVEAGKAWGDPPPTEAVETLARALA
jgi:uncharacterized protein (TIGR02444 family)